MDLAKELTEAIDVLMEKLNLPKDSDTSLQSVCASKSTSPACSRCAAVCCRRFALHVCVGPDGKIDWESRRKHWQGDEEMTTNISFMAENFVPVALPGVGPFLEPVGEHGSMVQVWGTCKALDRQANRCSCYDKRPGLCRKYLCPEAMKEDKTPQEAQTREVYWGEDGPTFLDDTPVESFGFLPHNVLYLREKLACDDWRARNRPHCPPAYGESKNEHQRAKEAADRARRDHDDILQSGLLEGSQQQANRAGD